MALRVGVLGSVALHTLAAGALLLVPADRRPRLPAPIPVSVVAPADSAGVVVPVGWASHPAAASSSPAPRADVDVPDGRAAALGGGAAGATPSWTGRHDREELRAQPWNDPAGYRLPRARSDRERATTEALVRLREPGLGVEKAPRSGELGPRAAGPAARAEVRGARPLVAAGPPAVEAARHGAVRDDAAAVQASDERHPEAFDLTTARAGGAESGVAGRERPGGASAVEHGRGDGGTPLDVPLGHGQPATRAHLGDDYFRFLYARVLARVTWPRELAVALEQGEVVVTFTLNRDGSVADVRVSRSSGFSAFDDAVVAAIRSASPFGPVPRTLADGAAGLRVSAPFVFDNPLIR
jgi:protein TonB